MSGQFGDGSSTFNIPNVNGKFVLGVSSSYALGTTGGEATHQLTINEMPNHNHVIPQSESANDGTGGFKTFAHPVGNNTNLNTQYTGGGQAHNNMPPYLALNFIIKT